LCLADLIDGQDVGMIQSGCGARFLQEPATAVFVGDRFGGQHLNGYDPVEFLVVSFVDRAHAAGAQGLEYAIMRDRFWFGDWFHLSAGFSLIRYLDNCSSFASIPEAGTSKDFAGFDRAGATEVKAAVMSRQCLLLT